MSDTRHVTVHSLASGSSGNAMLVQAGGTSLLIDAGLAARPLSAMLAKRGVQNGTVDAILLTHEHADHSTGAGALSRKTGAPIVANSPTLAAYAERDGLGFSAREFVTGSTFTLGAFDITPFAVPHDAAEPVGFVLQFERVRIAYFTDAGSCTGAMRTALAGAHLAVVEANHDLEWLMRGPYTREMKHRVSSPTGHLSNADCADLLAERLEEGGPLAIWLAHLSRVNNSASLARRAVTQQILRRTRSPFSLDIALRDQPSLSWRSAAAAFQLSLL